jgi:arginyl-tRNA synthetase
MSAVVEKDILSLLNGVCKSIAVRYQISDVPGIEMEVPKNKAFGDLSTAIALKLASLAKCPAHLLASEMVSRFTELLPESGMRDSVKKVEVKGPGFINFFLTENCLLDVLGDILSRRDRFGSCDEGKGKRVQVEFVSANPTGALSVAHGRQAAVGDSLANILAFCGYDVEREYYINDEGIQIEALGRSVWARYRELSGLASDFPGNGYRGKYIYDMAGEMIQEQGDVLARSKDPVEYFSKYAVKKIMKGIKKDLKDFGVKFNVWFSQKSLTKSGDVTATVDLLEKKGYVYGKDGAVWFKSSEFGDDKDRVIMKSDGKFTYVTPDIAYHRNKYERGFDKIINIWGPDHHGYIPRIKAAVKALGYPEESLQVLIIQLATLYKGSEVVPMSTRAGEFITLREVMDEVGKDAARYFFVMRRTDSHLDFDLELAKKHSLENPVYYIQYAHTRACSILEFKKHRGMCGKPGFSSRVARLSEDDEIQIAKALGRFPETVRMCARCLDPQGLTVYLEDLAAKFHSYYNKYRVVTDDEALTSSRLLLVDCLGRVIATGLKLLGVSAPRKM